ncbi:MAG: nucleotidyltransferase domain-containing protein, partial [Candidatus Methanoperedens sp.]|nr:nucleotidyltransferase domain-containing protein [Candidatus Methanoperedens sp.]
MQEKNRIKGAKKILDNIVNRLKQDYEPEQIILFGSYAYGKPTDESDIDLLNEFCDILVQSYADPASLRQLEDFYQTRRSKGLPGVSDMIFLGKFRQKYPNRVADIGEIAEGSKYENNINIAEGFEMESGRKKIYWLSGKPHGKLLGSGDLIALN